MENSKSELVIVLTAREAQVVRLLMEGNSNEAIGSALAITERTVRFHLRNVFAKLAVDNRVQAVSKAIQLGLIDRTPTQSGSLLS
jgi:LuxR family maltose regulon positive regulatory protein